MNIAFFVFNRPYLTRKVFERIRDARPERLLIVADGARTPAEAIDVRAVRDILSRIDWPCEVLRNYSDTNMGCKLRVSSGLDWVFQNVEDAIILEDDCLPDPTFFTYCTELLERYRTDERVMHIGGITAQPQPDGDSYYFSHIAQIWGWATWRRAWKQYDLTMTNWPDVKRAHTIDAVLQNAPAADYFTYLFDRMHQGAMDTWDVAWTYACMKMGSRSGATHISGLCIVPSTNLVQNIGFGKDATHTPKSANIFANISLTPIQFPLTHPPTTDVLDHADDATLKLVFGIQSRLGQRMLWFFKSHTPKFYSTIKKIFK